MACSSTWMILLFSLCSRRQLQRCLVRHPHRLATAFASLPIYAIPLQGGMSIGMLLVGVD